MAGRKKVGGRGKKVGGTGRKTKPKSRMKSRTTVKTKGPNRKASSKSKAAARKISNATPKAGSKTKRSKGPLGSGKITYHPAVLKAKRRAAKNRNK